MSIKIDLRNQIRQTNLPKWKPLLPLFEAVMNSFQAIKDANPKRMGNITIDIEREKPLLPEDNPAVTGFRINDNGIGLTDDNFDSFNTAFSPHKLRIGGKGLGRFTWLKAFDQAQISSTFVENSGLLCRHFVFDENYDLDDRGLPTSAAAGSEGTVIRLVNYRDTYKTECPRSADVIVEKLIEHFLLVLLEPRCPHLVIRDQGRTYASTTFSSETTKPAHQHMRSPLMTCRLRCTDFVSQLPAQRSTSSCTRPINAPLSAITSKITCRI